MRTLLVAYYWYPWNNAGTFRWVEFTKKISCDVYTSKKPRRSFKDETIPAANHGYVIRWGKNIPAILWGFVTSLILPLTNYERYIFTSPPESLLLGAWLLQCRGKIVVVDMRDAIDRPHQPNKFMIPIYNWFYKRIVNVVVCATMIDPSKPVIHHGYYDVKMTSRLITTYSERVNHKEFLRRLSFGMIPAQNVREKPVNYPSSSAITYYHLGINVGEIPKEILEIRPQSWSIQTDKMKSFVEIIIKEGGRDDN